MNKDEKGEIHISSEEMLEFFSANRITPEYIKLLARINAHVSSCEECRKAYDSLHDADEALDKIITYIPESQRLKLNLVKGLYLFENEKTEGKHKIQASISSIKEISAAIQLKVVSYSELAWEALSGGNQFYHPAFATSVKSSEDGSVRADGEIKSTLIDDESNRITIGIDRTLSLFLNKNECLVDSIVILIPVDGKMQPYFEYATSYDDKTVVARFDDIEPGEYSVAFKE